MTDDQNINNQDTPDAVTQSSAEAVSAVADPSQKKDEVVEEKTLPQSQVNELIGITRKEAYERGKREAAVLNQSAGEQLDSSVPEASITPQLSQEQIQQMIKQEAANQTNMAEAQKIVDDLSQKVVASREKYPDLNEKLTALHLDYNPHIAGWANKLPNTVDVLYEMSKNPTKYAQVMSLVNGGMPELAFSEMQKLSKSIEENSKAQNQQFPSEPLGQIKPTTTGTDNGSMTVNDIRKSASMKA